LNFLRGTSFLVVSYTYSASNVCKPESFKKYFSKLKETAQRTQCQKPKLAVGNIFCSYALTAAVLIVSIVTVGGLRTVFSILSL